MTKAAVDAARSEGRIAEAHQGVGFYLRPTGDDTPAPSGQENEIAHKEVLAARRTTFARTGRAATILFAKTNAARLALRLKRSRPCARR